MDSSSNTALFDTDIWRGKTFNGRWHASAHAADVIEPATGTTLGRIGVADSAAIAEAAA
ncbi:MAG: benzaldehyde dehydrogenase, partial [Burkholderia sp.]|nr:benzaldehyde dehydrogenase [Burkholderia sp.]